MANQQPFNFVSHDGEDENGIRAEVNVQVNRGVVKDIKENTDRGVADVHFTVENLKFPIHGWIRTDDEVYQDILKAKESQEVVEFRIEAQRKPKIDRSTPIAELRVDTQTALANTKVLLVAVNGKATDEAVTNPAEDVALTGGRYKATDADKPSNKGASSSAASVNPEAILDRLKEAGANSLVRQPVLDHLAALALFNGLEAEDINLALGGNDRRDNTAPTESPRASFAQEAPAWKEYNTDGRLNHGSSLVAAAVGIESLVYKQLDSKNLLKAANRSETLDYFVSVIFAIADRVQVVTYGENARPDRSAGSHIRVRGIVYDVIDKLLPLPIKAGDNNLIVLDGGNDSIKTWLGAVGAESRERFLRSIKLAQSYPSFAELKAPDSLLGGAVSAPQTVAAPVEAPVAPAEPKAPEVTEQVVAVDAPVSDRIKAAQAIVAQTTSTSKPATKPAAKKVEVSLDDVAVETETPASVDEEFAGVLEPVTIESNDTREKATPETISELQALLSDSGFDITDKGDLVRISKLLAYTFGDGFSNAKNVPDEELINFIDHYAATGTEGLQNAIKIAVGRG